MRRAARAGWLTSLVLTTSTLVACAAQVRDVRPSPPFAAVVGPAIIAHRGGSLEAPENTLASMRHGLASGADWLELDVTLSADGTVVVIHDDTLERTTDGQGLVEATPYATLATLHAGKPQWSDASRERLAGFGVTPPDFGDRFASEGIPTLESALSLPEARVMIELKKTVRVEELVAKVLDVITRTGAAERVGLASFETALLDEAYRRDPSLPLIGIADTPELIDLMLDRPLAVLAVRADLVGVALERAPAGMAVWVWTAYSVEQAAALRDAGAHGIITDVPEAVVKALRALPPAVIPLSP